MDDGDDSRLPQMRDKVIETTPAETNYLTFIEQIKKRNFCTAESVIVMNDGHSLSRTYLDENNFERPILVENAEGLGMVMPPSNLSVDDVERFIGGDHHVDVVGVYSQKNSNILLRTFVNCFRQKNRKKLWNMISLEFSKTMLSKFMKVPDVVAELSWVEQYWPKPREDLSTSQKAILDEHINVRPEVAKYCLIGMAGSFTDFHIDFGGTSVFYHILWGEKVFYLIEPSDENLRLFEEWQQTNVHLEQFFGDLVTNCYRLALKPGQTFFIPSGWIHAVYTPTDSLVIGGNFLHSFSIGLQIRIYEMEIAGRVAKKFKFPQFELMNWYAGVHFLDMLRELNEEMTPAKPYLLDGLKAMVASMKIWVQRNQANRKRPPELVGTTCAEVLKQLESAKLAAAASANASQQHQRAQQAQHAGPHQGPPQGIGYEMGMDGQTIDQHMMDPMDGQGQQSHVWAGNTVMTVSSGQQTPPISDTVVVTHFEPDTPLRNIPNRDQVNQQNQSPMYSSSMERPIMAQQQPQPTPQSMAWVQPPGRIEAPPRMPMSMQPQYPRHPGPDTATSIPQAPVMGPPSAPSAGASGQYVAMQSPNTGPSPAPAPGHLVPDASPIYSSGSIVSVVPQRHNLPSEVKLARMAGDLDHPPNSRLFVLCPESITDADMRKYFGPYGFIEDCWVVPHKITRKSTGICYIKFSKASEACSAMEEMDGKKLGNEPRPITVIVARPVEAGKGRESEHECFERLRCAVIRIPDKLADYGKPYTEEKIKFEFSKFGTIVNCHMTKSGLNCYVTFEKASQAATAIEQCDKDFSAVFVDPQKSSLLRKRSPDRSRQLSPPPQEQYRRPMYHPPGPNPYAAPNPSPYAKGPILATPGQGNGNANAYFDGGYHQQTATSGADMGSRPGPQPEYSPGPIGVKNFIKEIPSLASNPTRCREIYMKIIYPISRENVYRLCNLVPGLETLEWIKTIGEGAQLHTIFLVRYSTPALASLALEKLEGLEYPAGSHIRVRYADSGFLREWDLSAASNSSAPCQPSIPAQFPATTSYSSHQNSMAAAQMEALQNRYSDHQPLTNNKISPESSLYSTSVDTLSAATSSSSSATGRMYQGGRYSCSVKLSNPKAMLRESTPYEARLFFVCSIIIPQEVLEYAFSTFGDLISVNFGIGKSCGYIMYASRHSADAAMATMNNAILNGSKLEILPAGHNQSYENSGNS